jgi:hypothetical protein
VKRGAMSMGISLATDAAFAGDDDDLRTAAALIPDLPGLYSLVIHGTIDGKKLAKVVGTGNSARTIEVPVADVAAYIQSKGITSTIRLIACASGMLGNQSPAQKLANLIGLEVIAPSQVVTINLDGSISPGRSNLAAVYAEIHSVMRCSTQKDTSRCQVKYILSVLVSSIDFRTRIGFIS